MPKIKVKGAAKKRFKLTGSGRLKRRTAGSSHLLSKKSGKRKRHLRQMKLVAGVDEKRMKELLRS